MNYDKLTYDYNDVNSNIEEAYKNQQHVNYRVVGNNREDTGEASPSVTPRSADPTLTLDGGKVDTSLFPWVRYYHLKTENSEQRVFNISTIGGIETVQRDPESPRYALTIRRGQAFTWAEIHSQIEQLLRYEREIAEFEALQEAQER